MVNNDYHIYVLCITLFISTETTSPSILTETLAYVNSSGTLHTNGPDSQVSLCKEFKNPKRLLAFSVTVGLVSPINDEASSGSPESM